MASYETTALAAAILGKSRKPPAGCVKMVGGRRCGAKLHRDSARFCARHTSLSHG
jgi:hypothetical protein